MQIFAGQDDLAAAVAELAEREPRFARLASRHGVPALRRMEPGLASLLRIVTDQLISLKAAAAIWQRLETGLASLDQQTVAAVEEGQLRSLGLSGAKARSFRAIAQAASDGALDFDRLQGLDDEQVLKCLQSIRGIGPWTANIYLLMALRRSDGWPAEDLALQHAVQDLFALTERPKPAIMRHLAEEWRPWRGAAAHLLWRHYRDLRGIAPA
jgi:DNA-3-methyladenine glycosylase II